MADLHFNVEQALEGVRRETKWAQDRINESAAAAEKELRAVAAALEGGAIVDVAKAEAFHVFEVELAHGRTCAVGSCLDLSNNGGLLGRSNIAREIPAGRYRVLVQFTKVEPVCKRCGRGGHEASPPGEPAGANCRRAV